MKKLFTVLVPMTIGILLTATVWAQSPEKMSYQAVIRNSSDVLVTNQQVGMQISILQGSAGGTPVYVETQTPTTNANGLVSIEIGAGTVVSGDFAAIDWANGTYFIKTETDPAGGTSYSITGTSQLLSVPYALHAKTAETVTGGITETDPVFTAWDKSTGISVTESQISDLGNYIETETDPTVAANFDFTGAANGDLLQFNGTKWVKVTPTYISDYTVTESDVTTHEGALSITESQISDLGTYIENETDPAVAANFDFTGATNGDLLQFNGTKWVKVTPTYISDYTVTESDVTTHEGALSITESQISDLGSYIETESDPVFSAWDKSTGISITESQISDLQDYATTTAMNTALAGKVDKEAGKNLQAEGTQAGDMQYWNGTAWVTINPPTLSGKVLYFIDNVPQWGPVLSSTDVMNGATGKIWMDRNLGASQVATSSTDAAAYGDLYQWGRAADGHQLRTSSTIADLATSDTPGHGNFITSNSSPYDWRNPQNDNLWQGVSGTNNPCPSGYRLPTAAEWEAERTSWSSNNAAGAFASPLKLPVAGYRRNSSGALLNVGSSGYYWSSTVDGTDARILNFSSSNASMYSSYRAYGFSVRCLKD